MLFIKPTIITEAMLVSTNVLENDYRSWDSTLTYNTGDRAQVTGGTHMIYESLIDSNINNDPTYEINALKWTPVFATNKWRMFDQTVSTQSSASGSIDITLLPQVSIDAIAFLNVEAQSINVVVTDPALGEVYNETKTMVTSGGIANWHSYFYDAFTQRTDTVFSGISMTKDAQINISIINGGTNAKCGTCVIGKSVTLGSTQYGAGVGISDYSVINADEWGNYNIVERAFSKKAEYEVIIENSMVDYIHLMLSQNRATPCVYLGADDYSATIIYGIFKDFGIVLAEPGYSKLQLTVEGLT